MLTPDPRPTSFQDHPGLRDREHEARDLADVLRRLIRLSVSASPPAAETTRLTARLAALADELETHLPADPLPRFIPPADDGPPKDVPLGGAMPYDVVVGPFNPVALPVVLDFEPPRALGRGVFDVTYEGAPGCVHGAVLAAAFDIILTAANAIEGSVGPTVSLALRYLRPTLTNEEAVFEGWVTEVTDRRIFSKGRIVQGGVVTVEAEGEFAIFNQDRVNRMASGRRRSFDAGEGSAPRSRRRGSSRRIVARTSLDPSRDPADYAFTHRLRTRFAETDAMGVVHHAAYLPYLEEARVEYLRAIGHPYDAVRGGDAGRSPGIPRARGLGPVSQTVALRRRGGRDAARRRRPRCHVPNRLPAGGRRPGAGDRGDRARVHRRPRPPGASAGLGG